MTVRPANCDRARLWASASLDEELAELELRALEAHLAQCASCAEFAGVAERVVDAIRTSSPQHVAIRVPTRMRGRLRRVTEVASAAAAVVLVVTGASVLLLTGDRSDPSRPNLELISPFYAEPVSPADEARQVRDGSYRRDAAQSPTTTTEATVMFLG